MLDKSKLKVLADINDCDLKIKILFRRVEMIIDKEGVLTKMFSKGIYRRAFKVRIVW